MHWLSDGDPVADILAPYREVDRRPPDGSWWVLANMVAGLDGSAAIGGRVGELSDDTDRRLFIGLRALGDVVLVGAETVRREGYGPVRLSDAEQRWRQEQGRSPVVRLAVVTRSLALDWSSPAFTAVAPDARTIVVTGRGADPEAVARASAVADVVFAGDERVDLRAALVELAARNLSVVLCEGGPTLLGELAAFDLLDELCLTISPMLGGDPLPVAISPPGSPVRWMRRAHALADGDSLYLRYERAPR